MRDRSPRCRRRIFVRAIQCTAKVKWREECFGLAMGVLIRLEIYLPFRGRRIWRGEEPVPTGTTVGGLLPLLGLTEPELAVLVNGRNVPDDVAFQEGDEVAVLRRAEGG